MEYWRLVILAWPNFSDLQIVFTHIKWSQGGIVHLNCCLEHDNMALVLTFGQVYSRIQKMIKSQFSSLIFQAVGCILAELLLRYALNNAIWISFFLICFTFFAVIFTKGFHSYRVKVISINWQKFSWCSARQRKKHGNSMWKIIVKEKNLNNLSLIYFQAKFIAASRLHSIQSIPRHTNESCFHGRKRRLTFASRKTIGALSSQPLHCIRSIKDGIFLE